MRYYYWLYRNKNAYGREYSEQFVNCQQTIDNPDEKGSPKNTQTTKTD